MTTIRIESLMQLAREQLDLSTRLYSSYAHGVTIPSRQDPIRAEIARLTGILYRRVGLGEDAEIVYAEIVEQAKAAAREFTEREKAIWGKHDKNYWGTGLASYYSEDEAETQMRHAKTMALMCLEQEKVTA